MSAALLPIYILNARELLDSQYIGLTYKIAVDRVVKQLTDAASDANEGE